MLLEHRKLNPQDMFLFKPAGGGRGDGIFFLPRDEQPPGNGVAQLYLAPVLHRGFKFDLRMYVMVTSVDPLKVYIYSEGLTRFATEPYSTPSDDNQGSARMHLTNTAVNAFSRDIFNIDGPSPQKRSVGDMLDILAVHGEYFIGAVARMSPEERRTRLWREIETTLQRTFLGLSGAILQNARFEFGANTFLHLQPPRCFGLYGADVLLDRTGRAVLLELNVRPSLGSKTPLDASIKGELLRDTM